MLIVSRFSRPTNTQCISPYRPAVFLIHQLQLTTSQQLQITSPYKQSLVFSFFVPPTVPFIDVQLINYPIQLFTSISQFKYLSIQRSIYLFIYLSIYLSIYLYMFLPVCLLALPLLQTQLGNEGKLKHRHLTIYLSINLSFIYPSIHLPLSQFSISQSLCMQYVY